MSTTDRAPVRQQRVFVTGRLVVRPTQSRRAVFCVAAVIAAALLSFFVHVLDESVARGEQFRQTVRQTGSVSVPFVAAASSSLLDAAAHGKIALTSR